MKWLNQVPLLRLIIPFALGIILAFYHPYPFSSNHLYLLIILGIIVFTGLHHLKTFKKFTSRFWHGIFIYLIIFVLGFLLANSRIEIFSTNHFSSPKFTTKIQGYKAVVISEPEIKPNSVKMVLRVRALKTNGIWHSATGKILTYINKDSLAQLTYGDEIIFRSNPQPISGPANFDEFDFKRYLSHHYIYHRLYLTINTYKYLQHQPESILKEKAIQYRKVLLQRYLDFGIKGNQLAILSALTLGKKESLNAHLKSAYASAGAMHVLAVSGLHVGIIFLVIRFLLGWIDRFKFGVWLKPSLLLISIWLYAFITGLSPSVIRASTMFSFMIIGTSLKQNTNIYNTLGLSALIILLFEPFMILEVGFQLSYLAVIGIIYLQPHIFQLLSFKPWLLNKAWEITCVSISAQIITAPLGILYFHQFPSYFLFSNLIVIPAAFLILLIAIGFQILWFVPYLGKTISIILNYVVMGLNFAVQYIEKLPYSLASGLNISVFETWILYLIIGCFSIWLIYRKNKFSIWGLVAVLVFTLSQTIELWEQKNQIEIVFFNTGNEPIIEFVKGTDKFWLADSSLIQNTNKMQFNVYHHDWSRGLSTQENNQVLPELIQSKNVVKFGEFKIVVLNSEDKLNAPSILAFNPQIIYLNQGSKIEENQMEELLANRIIIFGNQCPYWIKDEILLAQDSISFEPYSLRDNGSIKICLNKNLREIKSITHQKPR
ncbi:MAG: ComEC/Rec2 family competence protein [Salibacteraceae bacterium]